MSQNIKDVKGYAGKPQESGGSANPTPGVVSGSFDAMRSSSVANVGWVSPSVKPDKSSGGGC